jgi:hypothetical protein
MRQMRSRTVVPKAMCNSDLPNSHRFLFYLSLQIEYLEDKNRLSPRINSGSPFELSDYNHSSLSVLNTERW